MSGGEAKVWRWNALDRSWTLIASGTFDGSGNPTTAFITVPPSPDYSVCSVDLRSFDARMIAPLTPFAEAAVVWRLHDTGNELVNASYGVARQDWWIGTIESTSPIELDVEGVHSFYDMRAFVALGQSSSDIVTGQTVFAYAQTDQGVPLADRRRLSLRLEGSGPWRLYTASTGGPVFKLKLGVTQPEFLFLARSKEELEQVVLGLRGIELT